MYTKQSKKMLTLDVLDILQKYTDSKHRLNQASIEKKLIDEYDMAVDRRSIKRSIMDLIEMGFDIQYSEITRTVKDKQTGELEEQAILTDFYLERDFSDCEIRLLIDELLDTKYVPTYQRRQLISKLEGLSSVYFRKSKRNNDSSDDHNMNTQLFYTLDIIDEAIAAHKKVSFKYMYYKVGNTGKIEIDYKPYVVTPYDMHVNNRDYLLLCSKDGVTEETIKINYIVDIAPVDEQGYGRNEGTDYKMEKNITFCTSEENLSVFIEEFGEQSIQIDSREDELRLHVRTADTRAIKFGIDHFDTVTVISPISVRSSVMDRLRRGIDRYA